jgi:hypothetical protein
LSNTNPICLLLWKEKLHNGGKKFYTYQQNKQIPLTSNNQAQNKPQLLPMKIQVLSGTGAKM